MTGKKILIINGHPGRLSYNNALCDAYLQGAKRSGTDVQVINIHELSFNPNLQYGYRQRTELEPDLLDAQQKILWAEHLVWVHPVWWGSYPAIMKGFIDRVFLPGFAFKKRDNSVWWDKLLKGKTATIICTMDQPAWYYMLAYKNASINALKKLTLEFCGIKPVNTVAIGPLRLSKEKYRIKWLKKIENMGLRNK
ncbi:NADPH:quinone reductase [Chitinophagaceae bacterium IBVUCB1]|nr:NADPH:quinone reductase [Chitinophagaceae bacterium IBVUCB1]